MSRVEFYTADDAQRCALDAYLYGYSYARLLPIISSGLLLVTHVPVETVAIVPRDRLPAELRDYGESG